MQQPVQSWIGVGDAPRLELSLGHLWRKQRDRGTGADGVERTRIELADRLSKQEASQRRSRLRETHAFESLDGVMANVVDEDLTVDEVKTIPGNVLALAHPPDLLVILTVKDAAEAIRRLGARTKQDRAIFEDIAFQRQAKEAFESSWFRELYEALGSEVVFPDVETSMERSRAEARALYHRLF